MSETLTSSICFDLPNDIKLPFPPKISVYDLVSRTNETNKRIPNAFIIYRTSLHHELVSKGYKFSLPQLSTMAGKEWRNESGDVKQAYINLANNAKILMSSLQEKNNTANYEHSNNNLSNGEDPRNNVTTDGQLFPLRDVPPYLPSEFMPPENPLFFPFNSSYSPFSVTNGNGNSFVGSGSSSVEKLHERIRLLEERQKLLAEKLGIQF